MGNEMVKQTEDGQSEKDGSMSSSEKPIKRFSRIISKWFLTGIISFFVLLFVAAPFLILAYNNSNTIACFNYSQLILAIGVVLSAFMIAEGLLFSQIFNEQFNGTSRSRSIFLIFFILFYSIGSMFLVLRVNDTSVFLANEWIDLSIGVVSIVMTIYRLITNIKKTEEIAQTQSLIKEKAAMLQPAPNQEPVDTKPSTV